MQELGGGDAFICTECGEGFSQYPKLVEHMAIHGLTDIFSSDGLSISNGSCINASIEVALHENGMLTVVDRSVNIPDVVETVGSNVELRNCFVKLMDVCKTSQSPERMHCQVCGKTFRLRAQLNAHLRSHSDEKPFKCDNCEKAFKYTWNLNKHKREHNFPPKFKCPICFRIFKYSYNRTRHLRHQCLKEYMKKGKGRIGDKYQCPLCKDMFTVSGNRNRHIKQTCIKLKLYRAKGKVKNRKELEELDNTKEEDKESPLTIPSSQKSDDKDAR
uniref:C2H2-type domain-containing protein n=1 Tax=Cyprinus carpio TaxID=7962 RepID=A0A8C2ECQ9_CYPCA